MSPRIGTFDRELRRSVLTNPPSTMVARLGTDIEACISRLVMTGTRLPSINSNPPTLSAVCETSITTNRCGLMRGVTVRLMPILRYW